MKELRGIRSIPLDERHRELLSTRRRELGITQAALAETVGITSLAIHHVESGKSQPTPKLLDKLCRALGLEFDIAVFVHLRPARQGVKSKPATKGGKK